MTLFADRQQIPLENGELEYWPQFLTAEMADQLLLALREQTPWEQTSIRIAGKTIAIPRLNAWYGDRYQGQYGDSLAANYGYSGANLTLNPWTAELTELLTRVRPLADTAFNSALLNWYRNGQDSVDWHSDDERELGANPVIASLSLGATRRFDLRQRRDKSHRVSLDLGHGSLLLMKGALQHHWHHRLPKQAGITGDRINITFRLVKVLSPGTSPLQT